MSDFVVFILAHGRPNITNTYDLLKNCGYTGKIIFLVDNEDNKVDGYYKRHGNDNVFMFDKIKAATECDSMNNFGSRRATLFARNKIVQYLEKNNHERFRSLLDNIIEEYSKQIKVAIIGGGTAGISLAYFLAKNKISSTIFEKEKYLGRNLTIWNSRF